MISQLYEQTRNDNLNLFNGQFLKGITITSTNSVFSHSLGREWSGYIITKRSTAGVPFHAATLANDKKMGIELVCATTIVIDLYIF